MRFLRRLAIFLSCLFFAGLAMAQDVPLQMDEAFRPSLSRLSPNEIAINWQIEPGYYLYRKYLAAKSGDGSPITLETPPGTLKEDPGFGSTEVYYDTAVATLSGEAKTIELTYQGCQDGGLCYPPVTKTIDTSLLQISGSDPLTSLSGSSSGDAISPSPWTTPSGGSAGFSLAQEATTTGVDTLLSRGGLSLLLLGFVGFGMLLAFTPCVFPMYPIVAAMLSREGEALSPKRGLVLSSIYVGALALAFGLFGVVAAWSGQNLQFALQSSAATIVIAVLFLGLAHQPRPRHFLRVPVEEDHRRWSDRIKRGQELLHRKGCRRHVDRQQANACQRCGDAIFRQYRSLDPAAGDAPVGGDIDEARFVLGLGKCRPQLVGRGNMPEIGFAYFRHVAATDTGGGTQRFEWRQRIVRAKPDTDQKQRPPGDREDCRRSRNDHGSSRRPLIAELRQENAKCDRQARPCQKDDALRQQRTDHPDRSRDEAEAESRSNARHPDAGARKRLAANRRHGDQGNALADAEREEGGGTDDHVAGARYVEKRPGQWRRHARTDKECRCEP